MKKHHNLKLPDHLYLSPPSPQSPSTSSFLSAISLFTHKAAPYTSPAALIQETSSTALAVGDKIPGFRTSAAFLKTLRANINLELELPDSQLNTPDSLRPTNLASSVSSLAAQDAIMADSEFAPPAALQLPKGRPGTSVDDNAAEVEAADPDDPNAIPPLSTSPCNTEAARIEALKLVADSVAQQRQQLSRILVFHPITMAIFIAAGAIVYRYLYRDSSDLALIGTTSAGILMSVFAAVRAISGGYLEEAERVGTWKWLDQGRSKKSDEDVDNPVVGQIDEILLTKFGKDPIGTVIFRGVRPTAATSAKKSKKTPSSNSTQTKTEIRAWAVGQRYRGKGVGTALLEDVIRVAHEKGWAAGGIEFSDEHANSMRILPTMFNGTMDGKDKKARALLKKKVAEFDAGKPSEKIGESVGTSTGSNTNSKAGRKRK